jgi:hypothetical protein
MDDVDAEIEPPNQRVDGLFLGDEAKLVGAEPDHRNLQLRAA